MRLGLLLLISQIMKLDQDLFTVFETGISGKRFDFNSRRFIPTLQKAPPKFIIKWKAKMAM